MRIITIGLVTATNYPISRSHFTKYFNRFLSWSWTPRQPVCTGCDINHETAEDVGWGTSLSFVVLICTISNSIICEVMNVMDSLFVDLESSDSFWHVHLLAIFSQMFSLMHYPNFEPRIWLLFKLFVIGPRRRVSSLNWSAHRPHRLGDNSLHSWIMLYLVNAIRRLSSWFQFKLIKNRWNVSKLDTEVEETS